MEAEQRTGEHVRMARRGESSRLPSDINRELYLLKVVMENTGVMLACFDTGFNFVKVNSAYARGCGRPVEELIGKNHFQLFPNEENQAIFAQVRDTGKAVSFHDKAFAFPDQPERGVTYWDWTLTPVKDFAGCVQGLVLSLVETTELRKVREERRIKDAAISSSMNAIAIADLDGNLTYVNPAGLKMWGTADEREVLAKNMVQFLTNREEALGLVCTLRTKGNWTGELSTRRKDGSVIDLLVAANLVCGEDGEPFCMMISSVDITARKRAEATVREIERKVQRLFESSIIGILVADTSGAIVEANDAFLGMVGYDREDLRSGRLDWMGMTPPEYDYLDDRALGELFAGGSCALYEKELIREDGTRVPIMIGAALWETSSEHPSWVCFVLDITARKQAEHKLVSYERLATLGKLSGSISHELRNPLAAIDASAFYLRNRLKGTDEKAESHVERIQSSVQRCTAIIESLLNLARVTQSQLSRMDMCAFTEGILVDIMVPVTVNVTFERPDGEVVIKADHTQLGMAFQNIVNNALQSMEGKGTLAIIVRRDSGAAEVSFTDSGPGIPPENMERIFQPLFSTRTSGIGFGLAIVKAVVERHEGTVAVNSEVGKGATFTIRLPLCESKDSEP